MKKCKCIALDLDGTLLAEDGSLSAESRRAVEEAIEAGIHVVVASGRAYSTLPSSVISIPGIEYAVTSNGAALYRVSDASCICVHKLRKEAVGKILSLVEREMEAPLYEAFVDGTAYAPADYVKNPERYGAVGRSAAYVRATRRPCEDLMAFIRAHMGELDSLDVVINDPAEKERLWAILEKETEHVYITASVPRLLELSDESSGKAQSLAFLLEQLGVLPEETAAFGNADNDADMLAFAGLGVSVENGTERCRAAADRICGSNRTDGPAEEIRRIIKEGIRGFVKNRGRGPEIRK